MSRLERKTALVTGGASGLGKSIAQRMAREGARVIISDVHEELGRLTAREAGFEFLRHDVSSEVDWDGVIQTILDKHNSVDVIVNNAGIFGPAEGVSPEDTSIRSWRQIFAVNVEGVFLGCKSGIRAMRRSGGGVIVNIASVAGFLASPHATAYGASKAAVRQLTKSVAQHCAQQRLNIRCNSVHPGDVRTSQWDARAEELAVLRGVPPTVIVSESERQIPLGCLIEPSDVAAVCAFLASEDARFITGIHLVVDGGFVNCDTFQLPNRTGRKSDDHET